MYHRRRTVPSADSPNVYAPPVSETTRGRPTSPPAAPHGAPLAEYAVERLPKQDPWTLLLYPAQVVFTDLQGETHTIPRSELGARVGVVPTGRDAMLVVHAPKLTLKMPAFSVQEFRRLLGPDLQRWAQGSSSRETKHAPWIVLAMGALWVSSGGLVVAVLALAFLIAAIGRLIRAGRWLFLLAVLRSVAVFAALAVDVLVLDAPWWLGIIAIAFAMGAVTSLRRFAFFRPVGPSSRDAARLAEQS